jgi:hypothetical protein
MRSPSADDPSVAPRRRLQRAAFPLAGLALFAVVASQLGWASLVATLLDARPGPLCWMGGLIVAGFWLRALKWRHALGPGAHAVQLFFLAKVGGHWTPARLGELAPLLLRAHRSPRVGAWILADRVLEVYLTLWFGAVGLYATGLLSPAAAALLSLGGLAGLALGTLVLRRSGLRLPGSPVPGAATAWRQRLGRMLGVLHGELQVLGARALGAGALTVLAKLTDFGAVVLLCRAFGHEVSMLLAASARCAHGLVSAVPVTPDATGVPFVAAAWVLHEFAQVPYAVLATALALELAVITLVLHACFALVSLRANVNNS